MWRRQHYGESRVGLGAKVSELAELLAMDRAAPDRLDGG